MTWQVFVGVVILAVSMVYLEDLGYPLVLLTLLFGMASALLEVLGYHCGLLEPFVTEKGWSDKGWQELWIVMALLSALAAAGATVRRRVQRWARKSKKVPRR